MNNKYTLKEAKEILLNQGISCEIRGDENTEFEGFASISDALPLNAVMLREKSVESKTTKIINELNTKKVAAIFTTEKLAHHINENIPMIITNNPRLAFSYLNVESDENKSNIDNNSIIHDCVKLGKNISIGPFTIIGSSGLSPNHYEDRVINTPHIGGVIIDDNVSIGANTVIVRAVMGNTTIGKYSILGHGVSIGHGCKIGKKVMIAPGAVISGSCTIGDGVWIGPNVSIRENLSIGNDSFIGIGSVVTRDVENNQIILGNPARPIIKSKKPW